MTDAALLKLIDLTDKLAAELEAVVQTLHEVTLAGAELEKRVAALEEK